MGPLQWWWRTWSKVIDPGHEQELVGARTKAEEEEQRADQLASELNGRDSTVGALEKRATKAERDAQRVQSRISELEESEAQLQSRVEELLPLEAEVAKLRKRLGKADAEAERLRSRVEDADADRTEVERLRSRVEELESRQQGADTGDTSDAASTTPDTGNASDRSGAAAGTGRQPDVSGAATVLGRSVNLDDLTVVEGIGPKIAGLLADAGISTWRALADADPDRLRGVLQEAGPRYRVHDPGSWPQQAALLADGKWQEFKDLRAKIRSR